MRSSTHIRFLWLGIWLVALGLRILYLDRLPTGISPDELHFLTHARSLALTGSDLSGLWRPWLLEPIPNEVTSELPAILMALPVGFTSMSLFWSKLAYAIIGSLTVVITGLFGSRLFGLKIGIVTALLMMVNPWHIFVSRTAFDAPVALFFWMTGLWLCTYMTKKSIYWSGFFFLLAFYSYLGTKVLLIPIIGLLMGWTAATHTFKPLKAALLIILGGTLLLTVTYGVRTLYLQSARSGELLTLKSPHIAKVVNERRQNSLVFSRLPEILNNKATIAGEQVIHKYLGNFSIEMLFLNGDNNYRISLWRHGYFYFIDAIFLLIGFVWLYSKHKVNWSFIVGLALFAALPDALRSDPKPAYAFHSILLFPLLIVCIAGGVVAVLSNTSTLISHKISIPIIISVYCLSFMHFLGIYALNFPIYGSEATDFSMRLLARYVSEEHRLHKTLYIVHGEPQYVWRSLAFYTNSLDQKLIQTFRSHNTEQTYQWKNVVIVRTTAEVPGSYTGPILVHYLQDGRNTAYGSEKILSIAQLADGGSVYHLYRTQTCADTAFRRFPEKLTLTNLEVEKLGINEYCKAFVMVVD